MTLQTLFAREESTSDDVAIKHGQFKTLPKDTVIYEDRACTREKARIPWHHANRPVRRKTVTLNCYRWGLEWV